MVAATPVLTCDLQMARHYALLKMHLRVKGKPIPENDLWIAALAKQHDLILATYDNHFREIDDLTTVAW